RPVLAAPSTSPTGPTDPPPPPDRAARPLAKMSEIPLGGGLILTAEQLVLTQPTSGVVNAFGAVCTHMGCTIGEVADGVIKCPCHGSEFSIDDGSVRRGPAARPLPRHDVRIDGDEVSAV